MNVTQTSTPATRCGHCAKRGRRVEATHARRYEMPVAGDTSAVHEFYLLVCDACGQVHRRAPAVPLVEVFTSTSSGYAD